jgi:hypothetical protein
MTTLYEPLRLLRFATGAALRSSGLAAGAALLASAPFAATAVLLAAPFAAPAAAQIQTILPFHRTADLLIGDSNSGRVLRARDMDQDGSYAGAGDSLFVYFDPAVAVDPTTGSPYGSVPGAAPSVITADRFGNIYIVYQGAPPNVFVTRDLNGDGDANGLGESAWYVKGALVPAIANSQCSGAAVDPDGNLWITADELSNDYVVKFTDLNHDGDANDPGEAKVVYDDAAATAAGGAPLFDLSWGGFMPNGVFYMTNVASFHRFTVGLVDSNLDGDANDPNEVFYLYQSATGAPQQGVARCARFGTDKKLYMYNSANKFFIVAEDTNSNTAYDNTGEAKQYFVSGDNGIALGGGLVFDIRGDKTVVFGDLGPTARLVLLRDNNNDGDARDPGDLAAVDIVFASTTFPNAQPRTVFFMPEEPATFGTGCNSSWGTPVDLQWQQNTGLPIVGNTNFGLRLTGAAPSSIVGLIYSDALASVPLASLAPGTADFSCLLYVDLFSPEAGAIDPGVLTDATGSANLALPISASLAPIAGRTFYIQALAVDFQLQFPIVLTNAVTIPFL